MVAKSACFELKKYTYIPILKFYFPYFVPCWSWMCSLDLLCISLQPWNGESGTSLPGGLWQTMMWSVWRAPSKKRGLVNAEDGRRQPQRYLGAGLCPLLLSQPHPASLEPARSKAMPCSLPLPYTVPPSPAFPRALHAFIFKVIHLV